MKLNFLLKLMQFYSILCIFIKLMHFKLIHCILSTTDIGTYSKIIYARWNQYIFKTRCFPFNWRMSRIRSHEFKTYECKIVFFFFFFSKSLSHKRFCTSGYGQRPKDLDLIHDYNSQLNQTSHLTNFLTKWTGDSFFFLKSFIYVFLNN